MFFYVFTSWLYNKIHWLKSKKLTLSAFFLLQFSYSNLMSYLYNFPHCPHCVWNFYKLQEYQKREAEKHRRKIILPCVIPWEYGTNKYASQKGSGGFGSIRNASKLMCSLGKLSKDHKLVTSK